MRIAFKTGVCTALLLVLGLEPVQAKSGVCRQVATLSPALGAMVIEMLPAEQLYGRLTGVASYTPVPSFAAGRRIQEVASAGRIDRERLILGRPDCIIEAPGILPRSDVDSLADTLRRSGLSAKMVSIPMHSLSDIPRAYHLLGSVLGTEEKAHEIVSRFEARLRALRGRLAAKRVLVQIDDQPLIVLGGAATFLSEALTHLGIENVFSDLKDPYPRVSLESVLSRRIDEVWILGGETEHRRHEASAARWRDRLVAVRRMAGIRVRVFLLPALTLPTSGLLDALEQVVTDVSP